MRSIRVPLFLSFALLLLLPSTAFGHAQFTGSFPKAGTTVAENPQQIWIEFDGNLTEIDGANVNSIEVRDSKGVSITAGKTLVAGARVLINLTKEANPGRVNVSYRVVSGDGHPIEGNFFFTLNTKSLNPEAESTAVPGDVKKNAKNRSSASPSEKSSPVENVEEVEQPKGVHSHDSFYHRHTVHIYQFFFATVAIAAWFLYERRKRRSRG